MQPYYNKKFRNRFTQSQYIDEYLEDLQEGEVQMMQQMGIDVWPRDENDIFVPTDKNSSHNIAMVEHTMHKAYGHCD